MIFTFSWGRRALAFAAISACHLGLLYRVARRKALVAPAICTMPLTLRLEHASFRRLISRKLVYGGLKPGQDQMAVVSFQASL